MLYEGLLPILITVGIIAAIMLFRNIVFSKVQDYPSLYYFTTYSRASNKLMGYIKILLKILAFLLFLFFLILYIIKPMYIGEDEQICIYIEMTPFLSNNINTVNEVVDSIKSNNRDKNVTVYYSRELLNKKSFIINDIIRKYGQYIDYMPVILITDRKYPILPFSIIRINIPNKLFITGIGSSICLYSLEENNIEIQMFSDKQLVNEERLHIVRGYNYYTPDRRMQFNKIVADMDTLKISRMITLKNTQINDKTGNDFIRAMLKSLNYTISDSAEIGISYNNDINKGIVISRYGDNYVQSGNRNFNTLDIFTGMDMSILNYSKLYSYSGEASVISTFGEKLIIRNGDVYYINIPADTSVSNILLIPQGTILFDMIIGELSQTSIDSSLQYSLDYRHELCEHREGTYMKKMIIFRHSEHQKHLNAALIFLCIFLIISILL